MKKNRVTKKLLSLLLMLSLVLSLVACGNKSETVKPATNSTNTAKNTTKTIKDNAKITEVKNYTEDLKKEKEVQTGKVYIQNGMAIGTMIIKDSVSDAAAKKLAQKYATELKKEYKDMKVNVQAIKKGKNIANITLEK